MPKTREMFYFRKNCDESNPGGLKSKKINILKGKPFHAVSNWNNACFLERNLQFQLGENHVLVLPNP